MKFINAARRYGAKVPVVTGLVLASPMALAQTGPTIDVSSVTGFIDGQLIPGLGTIGTAFLLVAVLFAAYRWIRGAAGGN
ncbi:major capsid protein [Sinimarinibacterium flocculans]|uniref:Virion coat protein B n=1 Tax=Sinimarinibacterium flocculans TaxID=985250 RepID=A0A318DYR2_9GAMM|nr:major capsid protein [Sinimarinibacterium flocculans]PXV63058.1 hypothetical protein C8D93_1217 [Sinimarinibacterium flocculans]